MKTLYPLTFQRVPLGLVIRNVPISNAPIKGEMSREPGERLAPAFSASGQDVWMPEELAQLNNPALVISAVGARCGKVFKQESNEPWGVVANTAVYSPGENSDLTFLWYQVNDENFWVRGGSAQPYVQFDRSLQQRIFLPPLETQQRIANYLDRETAEIDAAVADLEKYVELMEKRKLARIESVLSDMEYRMCPVGVLANVTLGKMVSPKAPEAGGVERQYLRAAHVQPGGRLDLAVTEKKMWFSESELQRLDLLAGDVVVVEGGAGFGRSAYLESDLEEWGFQNSINRVRVDPSQADGRFVHLMLNRALLNGSIGVSVDTATLPHFTAEKLARFRIPICEIHKQKEVSQKIHDDTLTTNSLIAESNKLRDLLLKRRSVLITDVITGRKQV